MNKADNLPMSAEEAAKEFHREYPTNKKDELDWFYNRDVHCFRKRKAFVNGAKWYEENVLSHHINLLAERIKKGATYTYRLKNSTTEDKDGFHFVITKDKIERIAKDYINELNLQSSK